MSRADDIRCLLAQLEDEIACAEHNEIEDGGTTFDLDTAYCKSADLSAELEEIDE